MDRLGVYLYVQRLGQAGEVVRVAFLRPVIDERHARSSLTLMAQLAWERERSYVPVRCLGTTAWPYVSPRASRLCVHSSLQTLCQTRSTSLSGAMAWDHLAHTVCVATWHCTAMLRASLTVHASCQR